MVEASASSLKICLPRQAEQTKVLGPDRVAMLQALDKILDTLKQKPELAGMIQKFVPNTLVTGDSASGLSGAAAILSSVIQTPKTAQAPQQ